MKWYEVVIKNLDEDWEGLGGFTSKAKAIKYAKTIDKNTYLILDICLYYDEELKETYDIKGRVR